ncbi:MAG: MmgE/PrpD family protein, partial [Acidimicrobiaceae bacterium]|nr:MmgE/PrpD family protein [Acidimicrobiaceae bacterium]
MVELAGQCLLDWLGVTLAGSAEPAARIALAAALAEHEGDSGATVLGTQVRLPASAAALVNGTASHALDYDDVNWAMTGHPTVAVLGALLALAETRQASGAEVLTAFVAGYETECRVGNAIGPGPYQRGFHATGTVGTFGAAAACARLLSLDGPTTATALGLAATQAAGLKAMFGTMAKPLHAGKAGANGLLAARLAAGGFVGRPDAIEAEQGFAEVSGASLDSTPQEPPRGWFLRDNLFKHHAACYETHSAIEGLLRVRGSFRPDDVDAVTIHATPMQLRMCAIPEPQTGLEVKFSLRHLAAMAVEGRDTAAPGAFDDKCALDPDLIALRDRVQVLDDGATGPTRVSVSLRDGRQLEAAVDTHQPASDIDGQRVALRTKFD